ncbi:MAG TPA: 16S rRNA (guanine(966)-N(2))-methyltransferase RsmD [Methylophilaceae bacterium]|jgi:16S rRNA (guanine(966)-N(2))-methyltransferase RsmD
MAATNRVRIGGGEWRSRLVTFPDAEGLRPTPDRVRQTLFNWLGQDLHGLTCLDLFAGTGVMGFESLSRGAKAVMMVEKASVAYKALLANKQQLKADAAQILNQDALQFLTQNQQKFDVIYLDPPYQLAWLDKILPLLGQHLNTDGFVYVEAEYQVLDSSEWQVVKHGKAGAVFYHLLRSTSG